MKQHERIRQEFAVNNAVAERRPSYRNQEVEQLVCQPVGRRFQDPLEGRCAAIGLTACALLRASHINRWADCPTDAERLDIYNGFLLAAHIDAAFDAYLISFDRTGAIIFSPPLTAAARQLVDPGAGAPAAADR